MPRRKRSGAGPLAAAQSEGRVSHSELEEKRAALEKRVERLRPATKASSGYRSVRALLGVKYLQASLAGRIAILQAADFLVRVLELLPPA
jgi:hypothetical protein